jgi:hypothetical protein
MKKSWTAFQDALLVDAAHTFQKRWILVQDRVPGRSAKECEERFVVLESLGQSNPFPKSPLKRNLQKSCSPKQKTRLRRLAASSPLKCRPKKTFPSPFKKTSPKLLKKLFPSQKFRKIHQKLSPQKKTSKHVEPQLPFSSKLVNRSPTKMNWKISNANIQEQENHVNVVSSNWNANNMQNMSSIFYSSPIQQTDFNWPFDLHQTKSSPLVLTDYSPFLTSNHKGSSAIDKEITLDDLLNFNELANEPTETPNFNQNGSFDQNGPILEEANHAYIDPFSYPLVSQSDSTPLMSSYADPLDPFASSFTTTMPDQDIMLSSNTQGELCWDNFFSSHTQEPTTFSTQSLLVDDRQNSNLGPFFEQLEPEKDFESFEAMAPMTISKDEVDDLFKDIVQEAQILDYIAPKENNIEWVTNNQ